MTYPAARAAALFLLASAATTAVDAAGPIYRCGSEYSQMPCPGGKLIDTADPRSAAQRTESQRALAQERKAVAQKERERRAREAAQKPASATAIHGRPAPLEPAASAVRDKAKKKTPTPVLFKAIEPAAKVKPSPA